ncbi:hypothetical protein EVAR_78000_1 [Eumeta japonica]|uniref:Uncharacterized protein n=1 Tax=Eumeta variegata TaxID=151549 RepID=A0A4C1T2X8_EUMVA|nr:hypothetical protein EVAR_78000_1 [Eumeta japonica]
MAASRIDERYGDSAVMSAAFALISDGFESRSRMNRRQQAFLVGQIKPLAPCLKGYLSPRPAWRGPKI